MVNQRTLGLSQHPNMLPNRPSFPLTLGRILEINKMNGHLLTSITSRRPLSPQLEHFPHAARGLDPCGREEISCGNRPRKTPTSLGKHHNLKVVSPGVLRFSHLQSQPASRAPSPTASSSLRPI
jgi:hypothetical protein